MLISFYHISLCPRCAKTRKHLQNFLGPKYRETVEEINVLLEPTRALKDKIKMVPALKIKDDIVSNIFLSPQTIKTFLMKHDVVLHQPPK